MQRVRSLIVVSVLTALAVLAGACGSSGVSAPPDTGQEVSGDEPASTQAKTAEDVVPASPPADAGEAAPRPEPVSAETKLVRKAAKKTEAKAYRAETFTEMTMGGDGLTLEMGSADVPVMVLATDGTNTSTSMDMGVLLGDLFTSLAGFGTEELGFDPTDLGMDIVSTPAATYLQASMLSAASAGTSGDPAYGWMTAAADGWVVFRHRDLPAALGVEAFGELTGNETTAGADAYLELLRSAGQVEDLGPSTIRGVEVEGYRATASVAQMMELQGADLEELVGEPELAGFFDDVEYGFDVYLDGRDRVAAVEIALDESFLDAVAEQSGESGPPGFVFEMRMRIEFFDYGEDIVVAVPTDAVDITDDFLASLDELGRPTD